MLCETHCIFGEWEEKIIFIIYANVENQLGQENVVIVRSATTHIREQIEKDILNYLLSKEQKQMLDRI